MRKINYIVIHHSAYTRTLNIEQLVFQISAWHREVLHYYKNGRGNYCAYHYVISQDGSIANPRPIDEIGYHCGNYYKNTISVGICLAGNFETQEPTNDQLKSLDRLIRLIKKGQANSESIKVVGHRDIKATACPGKNLYEKLKTFR